MKLILIVDHKLLVNAEANGFFADAFKHWRKNSKSLKKTIEFFNHDLN